MNIIKKHWTKLSYMGVKEEMTLSYQRKVILSNQLSIIFFIVLLLLHIWTLVINNILPVFSYVSIFAILIVPFLNKKGLNKLTAFLISTLTSFFVLLSSTLSKIDPGNNVEIFEYVFPRLLLVSCLVIPLVLIDKKDKFLLVFTLLVALVFVFLIDPFNHWFGVDINIMNVNLESYSLMNIYVLFPIAIILFGLFFLTGINAKYEDKIESYNKELKEKNQSITDSINYASRIQKALLPDDKMLNAFPFDHFILNKPRDIVSGDFYWMKKTGTKYYVAIADCTGHGVPGGFVSMLGMSFLNEIASKTKIKSSAQVLEELRDQVKTALKQKGETGESKDGMDIAFLMVDETNLKMQFAGANNPVYIIRNEELIEFKGTRNPIGIYIKEKPFENHEFQLQKGDKVYMFSDGYVDQFGGEKDSKFLAKNFKKLLLEIHHKPMKTQKEILDETLENWKGNKDQNDDILVMGIEAT